MGENISTTPDFTEKSSSLGNRGKTSMVLGSTPRSPIPPPKKKDYMGENISTTPDFTEKSPSLGNWDKTSMVLGSTPRSPIP